MLNVKPQLARIIERQRAALVDPLPDRFSVERPDHVVPLFLKNGFGGGFIRARSPNRPFSVRVDGRRRPSRLSRPTPHPSARHRLSDIRHGLGALDARSLALPNPSVNDNSIAFIRPDTSGGPQPLERLPAVRARTTTPCACQRSASFGASRMSSVLAPRMSCANSAEPSRRCLQFPLPPHPPHESFCLTLALRLLGHAGGSSHRASFRSLDQNSG